MRFILPGAWIHTDCPVGGDVKWRGLVRSWKQIDERGVCLCDERDLFDSGIGNIVHLAVYNNGDGVEQSSNMSCVCPSLFTNRGALLPEERDMEHIFQFSL